MQDKDVISYSWSNWAAQGAPESAVVDTHASILYQIPQGTCEVQRLNGQRDVFDFVHTEIPTIQNYSCVCAFVPVCGNQLWG